MSTPVGFKLDTYRLANGEPVGGEFSFVTELEWWDDISEPVEVIRETWILRSSETITLKPTWWVDDPCESCGESLSTHNPDESTECEADTARFGPVKEPT